MKGKTKYLGLLVAMTFVVGQVQYAYSSYFCTMKQASLTSEQSAKVDGGMSCDAACNDNMVNVASTSGHQLIDQNCMQLRLAEKKVVDNFAGSEKAQHHFTAVIAFIHPINFAVPCNAGNVTALHSTHAPPSDIPTLNSTLRI